MDLSIESALQHLRAASSRDDDENDFPLRLNPRRLQSQLRW